MMLKQLVDDDNFRYMFFMVWILVLIAIIRFS